jgi:hypothetical protein
MVAAQPDLDATEILARLERYAAHVRSLPAPVAAQPDVYLPTVTRPERRRGRIDPATVDLFPYDLAAAIVSCALTVLAFALLGGTGGLVAAIALIATGVAARQLRYFPSVGVKLLDGTLVGLVLVLIS